METTTDKFLKETELTPDNCMKRVPEEALPVSLNDCKAAFEAWYAPAVHYETAVKVIGIRSMLWSAFQLGWIARGKEKR